MMRIEEMFYLKEAAEKYGNLYLLRDFEKFADSINAEQLSELAAAYEEIIRREDGPSISEWDRRSLSMGGLKYKEKKFLRQVVCLLLLFDFLADRKIHPFALRRISGEESRVPCHWNILPAELRYLGEIAEKFGKRPPEDQIEHLSPADLDELACIAERVHLSDHFATFTKWLEDHPIDERREAWLVYSLFGLMDLADLEFE